MINLAIVQRPLYTEPQSRWDAMYADQLDIYSRGRPFPARSGVPFAGAPAVSGQRVSGAMQINGGTFAPRQTPTGGKFL